MRIPTPHFSPPDPALRTSPCKPANLSEELFHYNLIISFGWMLCNNRTDGMPRGDFNIYFAHRGGGGYVRAEEAVGIVLLVIILAALSILGCWYFRRRSGYKLIRTQRPGSPGYTGLTGGQYSEAGTSAENKMALADFGSLQSVVPNAPPAYEKISAGPLPPPYSP